MKILFQDERVVGVLRKADAKGLVRAICWKHGKSAEVFYP